MLGLGVNLYFVQIAGINCGIAIDIALGLIVLSLGLKLLRLKNYTINRDSGRNF